MISKKQRIHLMADCWNPACKAQGWKTSDRNFRLMKFSEILGRPLDSTNDIEPRKEFGKLKAALLALSDNVRGAIEEGDPNHDERRRMLWTIENFYKPCLRIYVADVESYLNAVLKDRFKVFKGLSTYEDLSSRPRLINGDEKPSQLQMYLYTLGRCLQKFRSDSSDSLHDMKIKAGVPCNCAKICCPPHRVELIDGRKPVADDIPMNEDGVLVPF